MPNESRAYKPKCLFLWFKLDLPIQFKMGDLLQIFLLLFCIFALFVKTKGYIAILLVSLFLVKFFAIDANGMKLLFNGNDITFVNLHCKKESAITSQSETANFSQVDFSNDMIALSSNCVPQFQFEVFSWETPFSETKNVFNNHLQSKLSYRYLDHTSPPPRLV